MKRLARFAAPALLALMTVAMAIPVSGCAGWFGQVQKDLPAINADINETVLVVSTIETFVTGYCSNHTGCDQAKISAAFAKVKLAASAVQSIASAAGDLQGGPAQAALTDLYSAYAELMALVKSFGVTPAAPTSSGGARMATAPGGLVIPAPSDLRLMKRRHS